MDRSNGSQLEGVSTSARPVEDCNPESTGIREPIHAATPAAEGLDAIRRALDIGRVSFDGDGWFATGAVEDGGAGLGTYDECEAAFDAAYAALARLAATQPDPAPSGEQR